MALENGKKFQNKLIWQILQATFFVQIDISVVKFWVLKTPSASVHQIQTFVVKQRTSLSIMTGEKRKDF